MISNKDNKNEEIVEIKKLDLDRLDKISGGYYGSDWKKKAQEGYALFNIVHTKNMFSRDKYAIRSFIGKEDVPISKSLAKKTINNEELSDAEEKELISAYAKAFGIESDHDE